MTHFRTDRILTIGRLRAFYQPVPEAFFCPLREHISVMGFVISALGTAAGVGARH